MLPPAVKRSTSAVGLTAVAFPGPSLVLCFLSDFLTAGYSARATQASIGHRSLRPGVGVHTLTLTADTLYLALGVAMGPRGSSDVPQRQQAGHSFSQDSELVFCIFPPPYQALSLL